NAEEERDESAEVEGGTMAGICDEEATDDRSEDSDGGGLPEKVEPDLGKAVGMLVDEFYNHGIGGC
ncbi:MAG: hypothetical protein ACJA1W_003120, partial [Akkermansiaceae bacterium]